MSAELAMWVIYERPSDHPDDFVLCRHVVGPGTVMADARMYCAPTLDEIRLMLPSGLVCIGRSESDEPQIVETWL